MTRTVCPIVRSDGFHDARIEIRHACSNCRGLYKGITIGQKGNCTRTVCTFDIKPPPLDAKVPSIRTTHRLLLGIEFPTTIQKRVTCTTLYTEGKHHSYRDRAIFLGEFCPSWDESRIKIRWDVFVDNLTFTHRLLRFRCLLRSWRLKNSK